MKVQPSISEFLAVFFPAGREQIWLRTFDPKDAPYHDEKHAQKISTSRSRLDTDRTHLGVLQKINQKQGIYFVVNAGGNRDEEIARFTAFYNESDDIPIAEQHQTYDRASIKPSIRVETAKSVHAYWLISGTCSADQWKQVQRALIHYFESDPKIKNPSRVMRLPGFNHVSQNCNGLLYKPVQVHTFEPNSIFTVEEMLSAFPATPEEESRSETPSDDYADWDQLNTEARRRICSHPTAHKRADGWIHCKGVCHDGKGNSAIALNPATGAYHCTSGKCATEDILRGFRLPERPAGHSTREAAEQQAEAETVESDVGSDDKPTPPATLKNTVRALTSLPSLKNIIVYDDFLCRPLSGSREWTDADDLELTIRLQGMRGFQKVGTETVRQAAMTVAFRNRHNCVRDWMDSLEWDHVPRIEHFFEDHFCADGKPYTRRASFNFWISMPARVYRPGCQVDNMVVLEGRQGIRKSSALRVIGGDWFTEQHESATGKAFFEVLQGKLLVEISEMDSFSRAEVTRVKQVVTCTNDRFRESYARHAKDHPRQCVGTTNRDDWNRDETGARRFWPIACQGEIDVDAIRAIRSQCFAEAVYLFKAGAPWWEMPIAETRTEQTERYIPPAWAEPIQRYLESERVGESNQWAMRIQPLTEVSVAELLKHALGVREADWTKANEMRVAESLRALGWVKKTVWRDGRSVKKWVFPQEAEREG